MTREPSPSAAEPAIGATAVSPEIPWQSLSARVIWVDLAQSILALLPAVIAVVVFGVELSSGTLWPFAIIAAWGVIGAVADVIRWAVTRYRVTDTEIERRTGLFVRRYRSVRRDRIRSVDTHAKLRHRIAGLRVVTIGAGQQTNAGEAAFVLDALTRRGAAALRATLLRERSSAVEATAARQPATIPQSTHEADDLTAPPAPGSAAAPDGQPQVFARLRPWWVIYNMFSIWAYLMAAGLLWGAFWLMSTFGINLVELAMVWLPWDEIGWPGTIAIALGAGGLFGAVGMGAHFLISQWRFELARVHADGTSYLRTRRGLLSTREVSRDEARMRGLSIGEPLLWRWMGMADTNVITTGLSIWAAEQPTAILPRGPKRVASEVAKHVLGTPSPLDAPLPRHPSAALRRRVWWATLIAAGVVGLVALPVATGAAPSWFLWIALGVWPLAVAGAVIAYRALGHAIAGDYLVVRSGLMSRTVSALRRDAVSTIAVRQSVLQRRLGLSTVAAMTAAGWSVYEATDLAADEAVAFAALAAPGLLDEFLVPAASPQES